MRRELEGEVYAAPDDDGVRSIYADWLIERGDPLGTFITLQLARCARRDPHVGDDEQRLLDQHWREWIGIPSAVMEATDVAFERGLWSACTLDVIAREIEANPQIAVALSWGTVRALTIVHWDARVRQLVAGPVRRSLRTLTLTSRVAFDELTRFDPPLDVEELVMKFDVSRDPPPLAFPGLPRLRRLGVHCMSEFGPRWIERADAAGIRDLWLRCGCVGDDLAALLRAGQNSRLASLEVANPITLSDPIFKADRSDGELRVRTVEIHRAFDIALAQTHTTLGKLGKLVDPGVKLTMQSITSEAAQDADRHRLRLVARPTRFEARPRA